MRSPIIVLLACVLIYASKFESQISFEDDRFFTYVVDPKKDKIALFLNDEQGIKISNFSSLAVLLSENNKELTFAMNGGMYMKDQNPLGLYIENGNKIRNLNNRQEGYGNFYMHPNGVFSINEKGIAKVSKRDEFEESGVLYATQSGPMLLFDGQIHPSFTKGSSNLHVRNAVGILPDGKILFVMSKKKISFYDLAKYFHDQGCENALYLDGFVSQIYLPSNSRYTQNAQFGVIIGQYKEK
ncbi:MAG: phosphodiester glycosidase family protein [Bacteroidota bacterium]